MNERIKELAVQADLLIKKSNGDEFRYGNFDPRFQKFAELIVQESMDIAKRTGDNFGSWNPDVLEGGRGGTFCVYHNIKNWFGVEE